MWKVWDGLYPAPLDSAMNDSMRCVPVSRIVFSILMLPLFV
jgi:hypothetical protein